MVTFRRRAPEPMTPRRRPPRGPPADVRDRQPELAPAGRPLPVVPSLRELADLAVGWLAFRPSPEHEWYREEMPPDEVEDDSTLHR